MKPDNKSLSMLNSISRRNFLGGLLGAGLAFQAEATNKAYAQGTEPPDTKNSAQSDPPSTPDAPPEGKPVPTPRIEAHVHVNQIGFRPEEPKRAVIHANGALRDRTFVVIDDDVTPQIRYRGVLTDCFYAPSIAYGPFQCYSYADFDALDRPGRYRLRLASGQLSHPFSIGGDLYGRLTPLLMRYFEVQRCGNTAPTLHDCCHCDDGVVLSGPRKGEQLDVSGGWHDAGDYLKFVETTSYVAAVMLFAHLQFPQVFAHREHHAMFSPLQANARVGLEWLLKMHPAPGEFYYQVGDASDHNSWRLPEKDRPDADSAWKPRPIYPGIGANLAGRTAAAFAMASRVYAQHDPEFAQRCLSAAESVYRLGQKNPYVLTTEPADFYPEKTWEDDMAWGAAALFEATQRREYLDQAIEFAHRAGPARDGASVYSTHAFAHFTLLPHVGTTEALRLKEYLRVDAEVARHRAENPYGLGASYQWGTAEAAAGAALSCLLYTLRAEPTEAMPYVTTALRQRDFILGCNPFGLSFLIGAGTRYPLFPHHQIADLKRIELSGALVGGPADLHTVREQKMNLDLLDLSIQMSGPPAADLPESVGVYHDTVENYVTNEPANDYTVKFLLLTAFYHDPMALHLSQKENKETHAADHLS